MIKQDGYLKSTNQTDRTTNMERPLTDNYSYSSSDTPDGIKCLQYESIDQNARQQG